MTLPTKEQEGINIGDFVADYDIPDWEVVVYPCMVLEKDERGLKVCEIFSRMGDRIRWLERWCVFDKYEQSKWKSRLKEIPEQDLRMLKLKKIQEKYEK